MDAFAAIAQPTRRSILEMLAQGGELSVADIAHRFRVSPPAISQHLKILRDARLVRMHKKAQRRIYQLNPEGVQGVEDWARQMTELWEQRFDALERLLKEEEARDPKLNVEKDKQHGKDKDRH